MLTFSHITVVRGGKNIVNDVSFSLPKGEITVLLGKNGTGKSTLLGCVNGTVPYTGQISYTEISGTTIPLTALSPRERAKRISLLPQFLPDTSMTVYDLVSLGRTPYTGYRLAKNDHAQITKAIERTVIANLANRCVNTLSGGEKQRAYLAMLLAQDTPMLLLDEPGTYLDADARRELYALLASLTEPGEKGGKTILTIMHDLSEAVALGANGVVLRDGQCVFAGSMTDCMESGILEQTFGVQKYVAEKENRIFYR